MNRSNSFYLIIIFNLIPVLGVAFYNWSPFEMFWLFWVETFIISLFNTVRVIYSQGKTVDKVQLDEPLQLNWFHAIRYIFGRTFIFLFYSIFIVVFIGFVSNQDEDKVNVFKTILLKNTLFNLAVILMFVTQGLFLIKHFIQNGMYRVSNAKDYPILFDGRQIVIHIAIIIGSIGSVFFFADTSMNAYASIWMISIFCMLKLVYEWRIITSEQEKVHPIYRN